MSGPTAPRVTLFAAARIIFLTTIAVKGLAMVRDILIAGYYGASKVTDAFYLALILPSLIATSLGPSLGTAIVPVAAGVRAESGEDGVRRLYRTFFYACAALALLAAAFIFFAAAPLIRGLAPGLDPETAGLAESILRWLAIWTAGQVVGQALTGVFQAEKRFLPPSLWSFVEVVSVIAVLAGARAAGMSGALSLAWVAGGLVFLTGATAGFARFVGISRGAPASALRPAAALTVPLVVAALLNNVYFAVDRFFGTGLPEGSVAALSYAAILALAPVFLFVVPPAIASLPFLSDLAVAADQASMHRILGKLARLIVGTLVPVSFFTAFHAEGVVALVYQRGAFSPQDAALTADAMRGYVLAMIPTAVAIVFCRVLYARRRAGAVVVCFLLGVAVKIGLTVLLARRYGVGGIALATSIGYLVTAGLMTAYVYAGVGRPSRPSEGWTIVGATACTLAALGVAYVLRGAPFVLVMAVFVLVYGVLYGAFVTDEGRSWLRKRFG